MYSFPGNWRMSYTRIKGKIKKEENMRFNTGEGDKEILKRKTLPTTEQEDRKLKMESFQQETTELMGLNIQKILKGMGQRLVFLTKISNRFNENRKVTKSKMKQNKSND